ncbi:MAG TPA: GspH/FimT family pseudopilin [Chthoniobacteraceae bacterium]|jgi:type II secretion system protein H|nr:GspH/FimT family pseudopilin [Chthoniobacteraceae bacterium]
MRRAAFTLIELMLVLAILAMMVALVAPTLARSSKARNLEQEAFRLVALTEHAREEAISQGVSMAIYVETQSGRYGMEPASSTGGVEKRKDFTMRDDLHFEELKTPPSTSTSSKKEGRVIVYDPEGVPDVSSIDYITITDQNGESKSIMRSADGYGYEVAKEAIK